MYLCWKIEFEFDKRFILTFILNNTIICDVLGGIQYV